jgi:carbon-monoxide dehydrogenase medium subunit
VKPAAFRYEAPTTIDEAVKLLAEHGEEAKLLAGGQSLVPLMNLRLADPSVVIDLNRVADLAFVGAAGDGVAVGAMTRHRDIVGSTLLAERCPIVTSAAALIGYPAIRNRGTIGGSLAHGDPVSELPCVALATQAVIVATGPAGERSIPASEFFVTLFTTALSPTEILTEVRLPSMEPGDGWGFEEFARKTGDFALAAVAAFVRLRDGSIVHARIALAGAADRPVLAEAAMESLIGGPPDAGALATSAEIAASSIAVTTGDAGEDRYRRHLIRTLTDRALRAAALRAGASA